MTNRRTQLRRIRRRVVAAAVALFIAAWLLIAVTLASGHDPSLSRSASAVVRHVRTVAPATASPSAVTTQQS